MTGYRTYAEVISDVESGGNEPGVLSVESPVTGKNHGHTKAVLAVENLAEVLGR